MHGVTLLKTWLKFKKFTLMLIRKVPEINVVICSKNTKKIWEERKGEYDTNEEDTGIDNLL